MRPIKIALFVTSVFLLSWVLPGLWGIATDVPVRYPFAYYSCITETFGIRETINEQTILKDAVGNTYTQAQFDSILPMLYFRQLDREGNLPDTIRGEEINQNKIALNNFYFRYHPSEKNKPTIPLYTLFESMPKRLDLEMPGDKFRLTGQLEFVVPETNSINHAKSSRFNQALIKKGFEGPPKIVAGNPSTRKSYDEGYFILDRNNVLFHLKMVNGRPYVGRIDLPSDIAPVWFTVTEYRARQFYGFLISEDGRLFVILTGGYAVKEIPVPAFNPEKDRLMIMGNLFYWNVAVTSRQGKTIYAVDASNYSLKDSISFSAPAKKSAAFKCLFPFTLRFTSDTDEFVKPRMELTGFQYLYLSGLLILIYILCVKRKKRVVSVYPIIFIGISGLYGVLGLLFFDGFDWG